MAIETGLESTSTISGHDSSTVTAGEAPPEAPGGGNMEKQKSIKRGEFRKSGILSGN